MDISAYIAVANALAPNGNSFAVKRVASQKSQRTPDQVAALKAAAQAKREKRRKVDTI